MTTAEISDFQALLYSAGLYELESGVGQKKEFLMLEFVVGFIGSWEIPGGRIYILLLLLNTLTLPFLTIALLFFNMERILRRVVDLSGS